MQSKDYKVAEHIFRISLPDKHLLSNNLLNYLPFICGDCKENSLLFHIKVDDNPDFPDGGDLIGHFKDDIAHIEVFKQTNGYIFHLGNPSGNHSAKMFTDFKFKDACVQLSDESSYFFGLNNCIMMLFAFASAPYKTLLMHASVIDYKEKAYLFLGKSGTGKSTHSKLWLEHIAGSKLLNDDNPVVRIIDENIYVYGSPWSGKTPCYRNDSVIARAFVRLQQALYNKIEVNSMAKGFAALMPSCSSIPWDKQVLEDIHNTISNILEHVNTYTLYCKPDKEASVLCYNTVK